MIAIGLGNIDAYELDSGINLGNVNTPRVMRAKIIEDPKFSIFTYLISFSSNNQLAMLVACLLMSCCYLIETTIFTTSALSGFNHVSCYH